MTHPQELREGPASLTMCTGCGHDARIPIQPPHLACCPDNRYRTVAEILRNAVEDGPRGPKMEVEWVVALLANPSPSSGSRSEAEGPSSSNPSQGSVEGDETLREALENFRSTMWYARTFITPDTQGKPVIEALEAHCAEIDSRALLPQPPAPAVDAQILIDNAKFWISKGDAEGASQWRFGLVKLVARGVDSLKGSPAIQVQGLAGSPKGSPGGAA